MPMTLKAIQEMAQALNTLGIGTAGMDPQQIANTFQAVSTSPNAPGGSPLGGAPGPQTRSMPRNFPPPGGQGPMSPRLSATEPGSARPLGFPPPGGQGPMSPRLSTPEGPGSMPPPMARPSFPGSPNAPQGAPRPGVPGPQMRGPGMPPSPNAPRMAPRPWIPPEFMRPSQLQIGAVSPSTSNDPVMGPAMAAERERRGLAPNAPMFPPSPNAPRSAPPPETPGPQTRRIPERSQKDQTKDMVRRTLGEDKANAVDRMPEWAMPMLVAGLATLANRDKGFAAVGEGGLAGVEFWQAQQDREFRQGRELAEDARADRGLDIEQQRANTGDRQVNNAFRVDNERLANDRSRIGLEAARVAQGDRALDLERMGLTLEGGRLDLDRARTLLEERRIDIEQYNSLMNAQNDAWRRGFAERELGQDLMKFHDNLLLQYSNLGIDQQRADDNAEYLGAMIGQMADNSELGMLNHLLERARLDSQNAQAYDSIIGDMIADIYSRVDPLMTAPEISARAGAALNDLRSALGIEAPAGSDRSDEDVIINLEDLE